MSGKSEKSEKGSSIPTRFEPVEDVLLKSLARKKGLNVSEVIRRAVRCFLLEVEKRGPTWDWVEETAQPIDMGALMKGTAKAEGHKMLLRLLEEAEAQRRSSGGGSKSSRIAS